MQWKILIVDRIPNLILYKDCELLMAVPSVFINSYGNNAKNKNKKSAISGTGKIGFNPTPETHCDINI